MGSILLEGLTSVCFALVTACLIWFVRKESAEKSEKQQRGRAEFKEEMKVSIRETIEPIQQSIDQTKAGVLSVQKRMFYEKCRYLLEDEHKITFEEFEGCSADHIAYNNLGGNDIGDDLFEAVENKYHNQGK